MSLFYYSRRKIQDKIEMNDIDSSAISIARKHLCSLFVSILFIQYPNSAINFHLSTIDFTELTAIHHHK